MNFIPLTSAHASICAALDAASFDADIFSEDLLMSMLSSPNACGFLAVLDDTPVGYALSSYVHEEAELLSISFLPEHQGKGYGRLLLATLVETLKKHNVEQLFLEVRQSNGAALGLYESFGGVCVGKRKGYYTSPTEDAYVYKLEIKS